MPFYIGDRVEAVVDHPESNPSIRRGSTGTVCNVSGYVIGVRWDEPPERGHSCRNHCENGYGWEVYGRHIRLIEAENTPYEESESLKEFLSGFRRR